MLIALIWPMMNKTCLTLCVVFTHSRFVDATRPRLQLCQALGLDKEKE